MSCAGYLFEGLLKKAEMESFNNRVLEEIQEEKDRAQRRLCSLQVKGDFRNSNHEITELKVKLAKLDEAAETMTRLLEA